jgi:hypothetical protein
VPGDGKFDQSKVTTGVELAVVRVDLADLPSFAPLTEEDLHRRYLEKDHAFRHTKFQIASRAVIDDNLSTLSEGGLWCTARIPRTCRPIKR